jgi:hypothetical protein
MTVKERPVLNPIRRLDGAHRRAIVQFLAEKTRLPT